MITKIPQSPYWPKGLPADQHVPEITLPLSLELAAIRYPGKPAYIVYGHTVTYGEMWANVQRLSGWLQSRAGVRSGDRVVLSAQSSVQFAVAYYAILRADAVVVPVNPMNRTEEFAHILEDSGARVMIAGRELWSQLEPFVGNRLEELLLFSYNEGIGQTSEEAPEWFVAREPVVERSGVTDWSRAIAESHSPSPAQAGPRDLCLIAYTSGTTAHPKGCTHSHRSLLAGAVTAANWRSDTAETTFLGSTPMFHMLGLQSLVNTAVHLGATTVLLPRWDARKAAELLVRYRVNRWGVAPPMLLDVLALTDLRKDTLESVVYITGGGAGLPEAVNRRLSEELGILYIEGYGMTETAAMVMATPPQRPKRQCLGIPTFGVSAIVVDPLTLEAYPEGPTPDSGELWVSGEQVSPGGYWNNDEANAASFVVRDGKRWLRTGDLVIRDAEGYHFLVDRLKRMINVGGFKVWPTEVESLLHRHPAIQEACVISVSDSRRGELVRALVVLREGVALTSDELIAWTREQMASYKCPREVVFTDRLLRSPTGKIDWRKMQEAARERQN